MSPRMQWICAAALLLSPLAATAAAPPKPVSTDAPTAVAPGAPEPADDLLMAMLDGPDDPEGDGPIALEDDGGGPGGDRHEHWMGVGGPHGRAMMRRHGLAMRFAQLDLTDAQREK